MALGQGEIERVICASFSLPFIAALKDKREKGGFEPFLVMNLDAVYKLAELFLLWAGKEEPEPVCYCYSYF